MCQPNGRRNVGIGDEEDGSLTHVKEIAKTPFNRSAKCWGVNLSSAVSGRRSFVDSMEVLERET